MPIQPLSQKQFDTMAPRYNRIPLAEEILADTETPLSAYIKLANKPHTFLLESIEGGEKWGRYSIIGVNCKEYIKVTGNRVQRYQKDSLIEKLDCEDPLSYIADYQSQFKALILPELPRFSGGLVGYLGYDIVRFTEARLQHSMPADSLDIADVILMLTDELVVFDTLSGTITLIVHVDPAHGNSYQHGQQRLSELKTELQQPSYPLSSLPLHSQQILGENEFKSSLGKARYIQIVERIKEYIAAGDVMQVVPSQRLSIDFKESTLDLYRALRYLNPSPYMYYLNFGDFQIIGSSPEILARLQDNEVTVRPIAGTRHRGQSHTEDQQLAAELLADPKEVAEHLMLIDLGRNDVGKVAEVSSVTVTEQMIIEYFSHVMHITSNVTGQLLPELGAMDVIRAAHPAGTLSGASKVRAMEIIDELEPVKRGLYAGAVGYLGWDGNMDMAIAIRTGLVKDQMLHVQAGGGVVADSDPEAEWQETLNKAQALFKAAALVKDATLSRAVSTKAASSTKADTLIEPQNIEPKN